MLKERCNRSRTSQKRKPKRQAIVVTNENRIKSGGFRKEEWTHLPFGRESLQATSKVR